MVLLTAAESDAGKGTAGTGAGVSDDTGEEPLPKKPRTGKRGRPTYGEMKAKLQQKLSAAEKELAEAKEHEKQRDEECEDLKKEQAAHRDAVMATIANLQCAVLRDMYFFSGKCSECNKVISYAAAYQSMSGNSSYFKCGFCRGENVFSTFIGPSKRANFATAPDKQLAALMTNVEKFEDNFTFRDQRELNEYMQKCVTLAKSTLAFSTFNRQNLLALMAGLDVLGHGPMFPQSDYVAVFSGSDATERRMFPFHEASKYSNGNWKNDFDTSNWTTDEIWMWTLFKYFHGDCLGDGMNIQTFAVKHLAKVAMSDEPFAPIVMFIIAVIYDKGDDSSSLAYPKRDTGLSDTMFEKLKSVINSDVPAVQDTVAKYPLLDPNDIAANRKMGFLNANQAEHMGHYTREYIHHRGAGHSSTSFSHSYY